MASLPNNNSVAIVLLNWNNTEDTLSCVESLRKLVHENYQIVIVDNGSGASQFEALKAACADEVILRMRRNLGFAGGCNAGIRWALKNSFDYVWLLNNDTVVDSESLSRLVETMSDARVGIAGGVMYDWSSPRRIQKWRIATPFAPIKHPAPTVQLPGERQFNRRSSTATGCWLRM